MHCSEQSIQKQRLLCWIKHKTTNEKDNTQLVLCCLQETQFIDNDTDKRKAKGLKNT